MCEPVSITAAVLAAGSIAANKIAQNQVDKARTGAMNAENIRQEGYQKQANTITDSSQQRFNNFQGQQGDDAAKLGDYIAQNSTATDPNATAGALPVSSNALVTNENDKQQAKVKAYSTQQGDALANLRSFGDVMGGINRGLSTDNANLGTVNSDMKGSAGVLPLELDAANKKGGGMRTFADLLQAGSTIAGGIGAANLAASGAAGANAAATSSAFATPAASTAAYRLPTAGYGSGFYQI